MIYLSYREELALRALVLTIWVIGWCLLVHWLTSSARAVFCAGLLASAVGTYVIYLRR